jgi:hypothetical protein
MVWKTHRQRVAYCVECLEAGQKRTKMNLYNNPNNPEETKSGGNCVNTFTP